MLSHSTVQGKYHVSAALLVGIVLGVVSMSYGQSVRLCGPPPRDDGSQVGSKQASPSAKLSEWEFIPSLCVSERYDSNVTLSSDAVDDYVTHVAPKAMVKHSNQYLTGTLEMGGINETYAKDSRLNFFGGNGALFLSLDKTIKYFLPNASFSIIESGRYTPLPPSFLNPIAGTSPSDPGNPQDAFARGIIAFRTNTFSNNASANFSYATSPMTSIGLSYSNAIIRYGSSEINQSVRGALFDITTHTGTISGSSRLSTSDTLNVRYTYSDSKFSSGTTVIDGVTSSVGVTRSFQSHSPLLGWSRALTPYLTSDLRAGTVIVDSDTSPRPLISWAMDAAITFTSPNYPATLSYSRSAFPSVFGEATPVIGNTVSLSASQRLSGDWQLAESANFSQSSGATSVNSDTVKFTTYRAAIDLYYWITRIWSVALSYDYLKFDSKFGGGSSAIDRHAVMLGVKATWE